MIFPSQREAECGSVGGCGVVCQVKVLAVSGAAANSDTVVQVATNEIRWGPYLMSCPECGASSAWMLQVRAHNPGNGHTATAVCASGHQVDNPLIYPEMVCAVADWAQLPDDDRPPVDEVLNKIEWRPHLLEWCCHDDWDPDAWPWTYYQPWEKLLPGYWRQAWPELMDAAEAMNGGPGSR